MPDGTGYGVEFQSTAPTKQMLADTRAFIETLKYTGAGIIQFIQSRATSELFFLENNPRLSAGVAETVSGGLDLPLIALQVADRTSTQSLHEFSSDGCPYDLNHRSYWFSRDLEGYLSLRSGLSKQERRQWFLDMLRSFWYADSYIVWQWRDPLPGIRIFYRSINLWIRHLTKSQPHNQAPTFRNLEAHNDKPPCS